MFIVRFFGGLIFISYLCIGLIYVCVMSLFDKSIVGVATKQMRGIRVDTRLLRGFYSNPSEEPTELELAEVIKVINLVMSVHFEKYWQYFEDARSQALLTMLERRDRYDSAYPPLGFCYTMARNEVGNFIRRVCRESSIEDVSMVSCSGNSVKPVVPTVLQELLEYMSGDRLFDRIEVPQHLAGPLLVFCERGMSKDNGDVSRERVIDRLLSAIRL